MVPLAFLEEELRFEGLGSSRRHGPNGVLGTRPQAPSGRGHAYQQDTKF